SRIDEALQPEVLDQLLDGMKAQSATLGAVVTVGIISEVAHARANRLADEGYTIVLIDGEQLSELYLNWCVGERGEAGRELV
ncbi:restriction endonuclease, partial [Escherichia coli]|uniref:restriction endonuclease n=2 Tax=Gammaproteobacteria TaxID=1236 RepID=UPI003F284BA8